MLRAAALTLLLAAPAGAGPRLYWFIPDGMRADPEVLDVFGEARKGRFPNIKRMMEQGSYGYSIPTYPAHTPTNFATLLTGAYPETHGVADGPMRVEGKPLAKPSVMGFSSAAKKAPPLWKALDEAGLKVALLSIPGSTPPDGRALTVRGRWGGWGADFHALNFESLRSPGQRAERGREVRLFYQGPELTRLIPDAPAQGWPSASDPLMAPLELTLAGYGATVYALVEAPKAGARYLKVSLSFDKKTMFVVLEHDGQWGEWTPITLQWAGDAIPTRVKPCLVRLSPDGSVKLRLLYDVLNPTVVSPSHVADELEDGVGPMVDFPDNWPAQLNRESADKAVLYDEALMALDWHRRAVPFIYKKYAPDVFIHDTYVPNQLLESRWWLRHIDPGSPDYAATPEPERAARRAELLKVYEGLDAILGEALKAAGPGALIVLSSDHGVIPIVKELRINNLFVKEGLLSYARDAVTGEPQVDWAATKAIHLKMHGVYLHPAGLAGDWHRGSGKEYEALRARVRALLLAVTDDGTPVFDDVLTWEDARKRLRLPADRIADLVFVMKPGYALTEEFADGALLAPAKQSGYKQALVAEGTKGLWTPFVVMGPGVKKGFALPAPLHNADQAPTLLRLLGQPLPPTMQGRVAEELLAK